MGTEYGLVGFDKKQNKVIEYYTNTELNHYRTYDGVYGITVDGGYLWTRSWFSGINRFDMKNKTWTNYETPDENDNTKKHIVLSNLLPKSNDEIYITDIDRGLGIFNKNTGKNTFIYDSLQNSPLRGTWLRLFKQNDDALWLANYDGIWLQNRKAKRFKILDIPYSHAWVMSYLHDETTQNYYFGLVHKSYGVACWNAINKKWSFLQTEANRNREVNTYDIIKDSQGVIWVAANSHGLCFVDKKHNLLKQFRLPDNSLIENNNHTIFKLFEDSKKNLWLGRGKAGVVCINRDRTKATVYKNINGNSTSLIEGTPFRAVEEDKYGRIWFGNYNGLCIFDPETGKFSQQITKELNKAGIRAGQTYSIVRDTLGAMWITAVGQGLVKITEDTKNNFKIKIYQTNNGLKDLETKYMTKDHDGSLWIVNYGMLYFNPYDESFMMIDSRRGTNSDLADDTRIMVDIYGNVFGGSEVGVNWVQEMKYQSQPKIQNLIIEHVLVNGESVNWCCYKKKNLKLSAAKNQNNITFKYTAICFEDYDQVRYRYKLEGYEKEWSEPTRILEARYTNLPPGKYRFVVDVAYKGKWLGINQYSEFKIKRAFWKTWWFASLILITIAAIGYTIYKNVKQQKEKQKQIRTKIASDLHDDVGSTLSSISIMSDILQSQIENDNYSDEMIKEIGSNAHAMLESMDDIIWSVNPSNDEIQNLILRIKEFAIPLFETKDIQFEINIPHEIAELNLKMELRRSLFLIAKEAINNLVKYSKCENAKIDFIYKSPLLTMIIEDDGIGFDVKYAETKNRNGLKNIIKRADQIKANLSILSEIGKGTKIKLDMKII